MSVNVEKLSTSGDGGIANAKPKYPPDASGGYNKDRGTLGSGSPVPVIQGSSSGLSGTTELASCGGDLGGHASL